MFSLIRAYFKRRAAIQAEVKRAAGEQAAKQAEIDFVLSARLYVKRWEEKKRLGHPVVNRIVFL